VNDPDGGEATETDACAEDEGATVVTVVATTDKPVKSEEEDSLVRKGEGFRPLSSSSSPRTGRMWKKGL
jgi:hypothetical protein